MPEIRIMTRHDIAAILQVQAECYGAGMNEAEHILRARLDQSPDSAWVITDGAGVLGYLAAYRSELGKITPLGALFDVALTPSTLYLHDLAMSPRGKGAGLGALLLHTAWTLARAEGLQHSSLVSVQGSLGYWRRLGYQAVEALSAPQLAHLKTYEQPGYYMVKPLDTATQTGPADA